MTSHPSSFNPSMLPFLQSADQLLRKQRVTFSFMLVSVIGILLILANYWSPTFAEVADEAISNESMQQTFGETGATLLIWGMWYLFFVILGHALVTYSYNIISWFNIQMRNLPFPLGVTDEHLLAFMQYACQHPDIRVFEDDMFGHRCIRLTFRETTIHTIMIDRDKRVYDIASKSMLRKSLLKRFGFGTVKGYVYPVVMNSLIQQLVAGAAQSASASLQSNLLKQDTVVGQLPSPVVAHHEYVTAAHMDRTDQPAPSISLRSLIWFPVLAVVIIITGYLAPEWPAKNQEPSNTAVLEPINNTPSGTSSPTNMNQSSTSLPETRSHSNTNQVNPTPSTDLLFPAGMYEGQLPGLDIKIGDAVKVLIRTLGAPEIMDIFAGFYYYRYGDVFYFSDSRFPYGGHVSMITALKGFSFSGVTVGQTFNEIMSHFPDGEPVYDEFEGEWVLSYKIGPYVLTFNAAEEYEATTSASYFNFQGIRADETVVPDDIPDGFNYFIEPTTGISLYYPSHWETPTTDVWGDTTLYSSDHGYISLTTAFISSNMREPDLLQAYLEEHYFDQYAEIADLETKYDNLLVEYRSRELRNYNYLIYNNTTAVNFYVTVADIESEQSWAIWDDFYAIAQTLNLD